MRKKLLLYFGSKNEKRRKKAKFEKCTERDETYFACRPMPYTYLCPTVSDLIEFFTIYSSFREACQNQWFFFNRVQRPTGKEYGPIKLGINTTFDTLSDRL